MFGPGVAGPLVFVAATIAVAAGRPDHSHLNQFISDLGATGTPNAVVMNYFGFVPTGLLFLGLAAAVVTQLPRTRLTKPATALLCFFGAGIVVAGLMSCDVGCPQGSGSLANRIHNQVSPLAFFAVIGAAGTLAAHFRKTGASSLLWIYSAGTAVVGAALLGGIVTSLETRNLTGLWQRLFLSDVYLWCTVLGLYLFRIDRPEHVPGSSPAAS